jgi:valyl-tRNA synthetase
MIGEPRPITHPVKFYEKGDRPLEIVTSRQWFVKTMEYRKRLLARGTSCSGIRSTCGPLRELGQRPCRRLVRQPQRFFGVPFPVWYPVAPTAAWTTSVVCSG